jgi:Peptidase A4 family
VVAVVLGLVVPSTALAGASLSTNWGGYAVHRSGVAFRSVTATWKQPATVCDTPYPTYEATWVGIGGYNQNSTALEQIGTELDCNSSGGTKSDAWYEVVPAPSQQIRMTVRPGDMIHATVTVVGRHVTFDLVDRTRHTSFSRAMTVSAVDVSSAEWIVEAPSACFSDNSCRTLPLTDFGTVRFGSAQASTAKGRHGSMSSGMWGRSKITLAPLGGTYIASGSQGRAVPSSLLAGGSAFNVTYSAYSSPFARDVFGPRASGPPPPSAVNPGGRRR